MKRVLLLLTVLLALGISNVAFADLTFVIHEHNFGSGLGNENTLVTVQDNQTGSPNSNGIESGGINQNGTFTPVDQFGILGGDNLAINNVITFDNTILSSYGAVVNVSEQGNDKSLVLTDLYLTFVGTSGVPYTAYYNGDPITLASDTSVGTGRSGWLFVLDPTEAAIVAGLGNTVTVSGGVQFAEGTTDDGNETVFVVRAGETTPTVPEPTSMLLLGLGLVGLAGVRRKFKQ